MVCFVRILSHSWEACPIMAPVLDARASLLAMKPLLTNLAQRGSGGVTPVRVRADNLEQAQGGVLQRDNGCHIPDRGRERLR